MAWLLVVPYHPLDGFSKKTPSLINGNATPNKQSESLATTLKIRVGRSGFGQASQDRILAAMAAFAIFCKLRQSSRSQSIAAEPTHFQKAHTRDTRFDPLTESLLFDKEWRFFFVRLWKVIVGVRDGFVLFFLLHNLTYSQDIYTYTYIDALCWWFFIAF